MEPSRLLSKIHEQDHLDHADLIFIDSISCCYSQIIPSNMQDIKMADQLWLILEKKKHCFWEIMSTVVTQCQTQQTKALAILTIKKRVIKDWEHLSPSIKNNIMVYLIDTIDLYCEKSSSTQDNSEKLVLINCNLALVEIFKFQWTALLADFLSNLCQNVQQSSLGRLVNKLVIFKLLLEESFGSWLKQMTTFEVALFRKHIEGQLRKIIEVIDFSLRLQNVHHQLLIPEALKVLALIVEFIPIYYVFNSSLLETIQKLICIVQIRHDLIFCLEKICYKVTHDNSIKDFLEKALKRMFEILNNFLESLCDEDSYEIQNCQKYSHSTFDQSNRKSKKDFTEQKENKPYKKYKDDHGMLIHLIYTLLCSDQECILKLTNQTSTNTQKNIPNNIQSSQLKHALKEITLYLFSTIQNKYAFNLIVDELISEDMGNFMRENQNILEIIWMLLKINSNNHTFERFEHQNHSFLNNMPYELIRCIVMKLAPFEEKYRRYYSGYKLIIADKEELKCQKQLNFVEFTKEYYQNYDKILALIGSQKYYKDLYEKVIQNTLSSIFKNQEIHFTSDRSERVSRIRYKIDRDRLSVSNGSKKDQMFDDEVQQINSLNRVAWSIVAFSQQVQTSNKLKTIIKIYQKNYEKSFGSICLKKCLGINIKYLALQNGSEHLGLQSLYDSLDAKEDLQKQLVLEVLGTLMKRPQVNSESIYVEAFEPISAFMEESQFTMSLNEDHLSIYSGLMHVIMEICDRDKAQELNTFLSKIVNFSLTNLIDHKHFDILENLPFIHQAIYHINVIQEITLHIINHYSGILKRQDDRSLIELFWHFDLILLRSQNLLERKYGEYNQKQIELDQESNDLHYKSWLREFRQKYNVLATNYVKYASFMNTIFKGNKCMAKDAQNIESMKANIERMSVYLWDDFEVQLLESKCSEYFNFLIEEIKYFYINWQDKSNQVTLKNRINQQIRQITKYMNSILQDQTINSQNMQCLTNFQLHRAYFIFTRDLLNLEQVFIDLLNQTNAEALIQQVIFISQIDVPAVSEIALEILSRMVNLLSDSISNKSPKLVMWEYFLALVEITFKLFFSVLAQNNEESLDKIIKIFIIELEITNKSAYKIKSSSQSKQNNREVLESFLKKMIEKTYQIEDQQWHNEYFKNIFFQVSVDEFLTLTKNYIVKFTKYYQKRSVNSQ